MYQIQRRDVPRRVVPRMMAADLSIMFGGSGRSIIVRMYGLGLFGIFLIMAPDARFRLLIRIIGPMTPFRPACRFVFIVSAVVMIGNQTLHGKAGDMPILAQPARGENNRINPLGQAEDMLGGAVGRLTDSLAAIPAFDASRIALA